MGFLFVLLCFPLKTRFEAVQVCKSQFCCILRYTQFFFIFPLHRGTLYGRNRFFTNVERACLHLDWIDEKMSIKK